MLRPALLLIALTSPALAQDLATADQIRASIIGNTVMGSMSASGAYTEFYATDGSIRAADYAGSWSLQGDTMCFSYGADPATCWSARISGDQVTWVVGGADEGTGTILPGNPNGW
ncbi:MAG: hypothetical protein ACRC6I_05605 [Paracoccaceae bacterium]